MRILLDLPSTAALVNPKVFFENYPQPSFQKKQFLNRLCGLLWDNVLPDDANKALY